MTEQEKEIKMLSEEVAKLKNDKIIADLKIQKQALQGVVATPQNMVVTPENTVVTPQNTVVTPENNTGEKPVADIKQVEVKKAEEVVEIKPQVAALNNMATGSYSADPAMAKALKYVKEMMEI